MAEKLPQISGRRAAQAFVRAGWVIREVGPHIRKAGLTVVEFNKLLS